MTDHEQPVTERVFTRVAMRVEGKWWVAYLAEPDTMAGAKVLGRIRMNLVVDNKARKEMFLEIFKHYVLEQHPETSRVDVSPAPEHEKAGNA